MAGMTLAFGTGAAVYYVDPAGSDSNDGLTTSSAWATVSKVNGAALKVGDSVLFKRGGAWRGSTLVVPASGVAFGAYGVGGADPILSGGTLVTGWSATSGGTYSAALASLPGVPPMVTYTVSNKTTVLTAGSGSGSLSANQYFYTAPTLYVNLGDTVAPQGQVEVASRQILTSSAKANLTFQHLDFRYGSDSGLVIQDANGHLFDSCSFRYTTYNNNYAGALNWTNGGAGSGRITNCTFDSLGNDGIYLVNTQNVEIDHNTITNVGGLINDQQSDGIQVEGTAAASNSDGCWIHDNYVSMGTQTPKGCIIVNTAPSLGATANVIVERNECVGGKFGVAAHASNLVVRNNVIHGQTSTDAQAIWIAPNEVYVGMVLVYNLIYACYFGINAGTGTNSRQVVIAHNTIVDCSRAHVVFDCPTYGLIKNNILWNTGALPTLRLLYIGSVTGGQTLAIDYNIYAAAFTNYLFLGGVYEASTFALWKSNTNQDAHTQIADPLFTSSSARNYTLTANSPAINAGAIVPNISQSILGSAPDLGYAEAA